MAALSGKCRYSDGARIPTAVAIARMLSPAGPASSSRAWATSTISSLRLTGGSW
ncbi:MAG: hypothetical protein U0R79_09705 [Propionicimonas sp.]